MGVPQEGRRSLVSRSSAPAAALVPLLAASLPLLGCAPRAPRPDAVEVTARALAWGEQGVLEPQGIAADFGRSVAIRGDVALAGEANGDSSTDDADAEIFVRSAGAWSWVQSFAQIGLGFSPRNFGFSVALSDDTALVGSVGEISNVVGVPGKNGAAFMFVPASAAPGAPWTLLQGVAAPDGAPNDDFGRSVALSGDTALVGAAFDLDELTKPEGAAYVFVRQGAGASAVWTFQQELRASDGAPANFFGRSVALDGDTAVVAAGGTAAYVFVRAGSTWTQQAKLSAPTLVAVASTDHVVAVVGDTALVAQDLFVRAGATWTEQQALMPAGYTNVIKAVALADGVAILSNPGSSVASQMGRAFVFTRQGATWTQKQELVSSAVGPADEFGASLAISGDTVLVGATKASSADRGAVVAFVLRKEAGEACAAGADCLSGNCADGVCCNTACDGACDACSRAAGAMKDGACVPVAAGSPGSPACGALACTGQGPACTTCSADGDCPAGRYCAPDGSCLPRKAGGDACDIAAGADCKVAGCRVCADAACASNPTAPLVCTAAGRCGCAAPTTSCAGDTTLATASGDVVDCTPYKCEGAACRMTCVVSAHCADGYVCHPDTGRCVSATGSPPGRDGCGCGLRGEGSGPGALGGAAALAALAAGLATGARAGSRRRGRRGARGQAAGASPR
jgi:hypothetical protein